MYQFGWHVEYAQKGATGHDWKIGEQARSQKALNANQGTSITQAVERRGFKESNESKAKTPTGQKKLMLGER